MDIKSYFANIPRKQLIIMVAIVTVGIAVGYWRYLLKPIWEEQSRLTQEHQALQAELGEKQRIAQDLPRLEQELKALQIKLTQALAKLPEEKEIPSLLIKVNALGRQVGLDFLLFRPSPAIAKGFYAEIPIQIKVEGSYHALGRFFDKISKMERIVSISDLKVGPAVSKRKGVTVVAEFSAITYTFGGGRGVEAGKGAS